MIFFAVSRVVSALILIAALLSNSTLAEQPQTNSVFPCPEKLTYRIEWRLVTAGTATVQQTRGSGSGWDLNLNLQSAGLVSRLYKVLDTYKAVTADRFCGSSAVLDAQEGKKRIQTHLNFDNAHKKVEYTERDLIKNTTTNKELDTPPCSREILGALAAIRLSPPELGKPMSMPITDGKKVAFVKVSAQAKETLNINGKNYSTIRYEAFLFDNVLYKRKGRLFLWMTEDAGHLPVQLQVHLGFPVGNITIQLEKDEKL